MPSKKSSSKSKADDTPTQEAVTQAEAPKADVHKSGGKVKAQSAIPIRLMVETTLRDDGDTDHVWLTSEHQRYEVAGGRIIHGLVLAFDNWVSAIEWAREIGGLDINLIFDRHERGEIWPDDIDGKLIIE